MCASLLLFFGTLMSYAIFPVGASAQQQLDSRVIPQEVIPLVSERNRSLLVNDLQAGRTTTADSEYVAFVLDTSGSVLGNVSRSEIMSRIQKVMDFYEFLVGFQVINDLGEYVLRSTRGQWIPFNDQSVSEIFERLESWNPISSSNPIGGISEVLNNLSTEGQRTSIYIIGDDLRSSLSVQDVASSIIEMNQIVPTLSRAKIHAIIFPTFLVGEEQYRTGTNNLISLMRQLADSTGGTLEIADLGSLD